MSVCWTLTIELIFYAICFVAFAAGALLSARFNLGMVLFLATAALAIRAATCPQAR